MSHSTLVDLDQYLAIHAAQLPVIGTAGQEKLRRATVVVKGVGRLGTNIITDLICAGVGHVLGHDPQRVTADTLSGSILAGRTDIGSLKPYALERLLHHRPGVVFQPLVTEFEFDAACYGTTLIISAANTVRGRRLAAKSALKRRRPIIDVGVTDGREHSGGHVSLWHPDNADWSACPACWYGDGLRLKRGEGLLATVIGTLAGIAATIAVQYLTGADTAFIKTNNFIAVDLETFQMQGMAVERRSDCSICGSKERK